MSVDTLPSSKTALSSAIARATPSELAYRSVPARPCSSFPPLLGLAVVGATVSGVEARATATPMVAEAAQARKMAQKGTSGEPVGGGGGGREDEA